MTKRTKFWLPIECLGTLGFGSGVYHFVPLAVSDWHWAGIAALACMGMCATCIMDGIVLITQRPE